MLRLPPWNIRLRGRLLYTPDSLLAHSWADGARNSRGRDERRSGSCTGIAARCHPD